MVFYPDGVCLNRPPCRIVSSNVSPRCRVSVSRLVGDVVLSSVTGQLLLTPALYIIVAQRLLQTSSGVKANMCPCDMFPKAHSITAIPAVHVDDKRKVLAELDGKLAQ